MSVCLQWCFCRLLMTWWKHLSFYRTVTKSLFFTLMLCWSLKLWHHAHWRDTEEAALSPVGKLCTTKRGGASPEWRHAACTKEKSFTRLDDGGCRSSTRFLLQPKRCHVHVCPTGLQCSRCGFIVFSSVCSHFNLNLICLYITTPKSWVSPYKRTF